MRHRLALMFMPLTLLAAMSVTVPVQARQVTVIQPLTVSATQGLKITGMDVTFGETFRKEQEESDAKAACKRAAAGLPALDPASYPSGPQPPEAYDTLPFKQMFPLVMRDVTKDWGLDHGRPVTLRITLERLKTADAAIAILLAPSADVLDGTVQVLDTATAAPLGSFRVSVVNVQGGWAQMLMRGWGVREKLAKEFGLELSRHLSGRSKKPA
ncbi:hypothetical protein PX699_03240 [Sphingobium sp. H39-3-25]|uniref:hypothetical protein n=1 Tax=Sphingobium arseniciresistens TaxID=3030834 RepID=UPI0023BA036F|nr:hypothetical protein [Sphingobium arseniciresistens]